MKQEDIEKLKEINTTMRIYIDCCMALRRRIDNHELRLISLEIKQKREDVKNEIYNGINKIIQFIPWIVILILAWLFYKFN
jgi:uncharacterized membrane protein (DUF106 family)